MALPALPIAAETRRITDITNVLVRDFNGRRAGIPTSDLPPDPAPGEAWLVNDVAGLPEPIPVTGGGTGTAVVMWDGTQWVTMSGIETTTGSYTPVLTASAGTIPTYTDTPLNGLYRVLGGLCFLGISAINTAGGTAGAGASQMS